MKIVITGSTKGIGKALAKEFLAAGDNVLITSRNSTNLDATLDEFQELYPNIVEGKLCDVQQSSDLEDLVRYAIEKFGMIDIWINNAGTAGSERLNLMDMNPAEIFRIINTNITGTLLGCRAVIPQMIKQQSGHIYNMEGLGSDGRTYAGNLCYATSKRAIPMIKKTLLKELKDTGIGIHDLSPGMVMTDLILGGSSQDPVQFKKVLNILAELPETVARYLVPRIRSMKSVKKDIKFLTGFKAAVRFIMAGKRKNRFFDDETGQLVGLPIKSDI